MHANSGLGCDFAHMLNHRGLVLILKRDICANTSSMHAKANFRIRTASHQFKQILQPIRALLPVLPPVRICVWWPPTKWLSECITILRVSSIASSLQSSHRYLIQHLADEVQGVLPPLLSPPVPSCVIQSAGAVRKQSKDCVAEGLPGPAAFHRCPVESARLQGHWACSYTGPHHQG